MDEKFNRRYLSFCNSLDALAEARQRDLTDSFVLSGTSAKFSITFDLAWKVMKAYTGTVLCDYRVRSGISKRSIAGILQSKFDRG